jgi:hypothetical protein
MDNKKLLAIFVPIVVIIALAVAGYAWVNSHPVPPSPSGSTTSTNETPITSTSTDGSIDQPVTQPTTSTVSMPNWKTYTQPGMFTIMYPPDFTVEKGSGLGGAYLPNFLLKISFPRTAFASDTSNFVEAYLVASTGPNDARCSSLEDLPNTEGSAQTKMVGGLPFKYQTAADAGAGNLYNSEVYRAAMGNTCGEIALTVHTGNIGNYPPGIKEFNQRKAFDVLEQMVGTIHFKLTP